MKKEQLNMKTEIGYCGIHKESFDDKGCPKCIEESKNITFYPPTTKIFWCEKHRMNFKGVTDCPRCLSEASMPSIPKDNDPVNHPSHYTSHPSRVECIQVTRHMNFNKGNAIKYIWRAGEKGNEIQDLQKAIWYLNDEISRLENLINKS
jgi:hypothetical protein